MGWFPKDCVPVVECRKVATTLCPDEASKYSFTAAGIANDDCTSCSLWNGSFDLKYMGADRWDTAVSTTTSCGHASGDPLWRMYVSGSGVSKRVRLEAVGLGYSWSKLASSWSCMSTNTLTKDSVVIVPNKCVGLPTAIDVSPCLISCTQCTGTPPSAISVAVTGVMGDKCDCSFLNSIFVLNAWSSCCWKYVELVPCGYGCDVWLTVTACIKTSATYPFGVYWDVIIQLAMAPGCTDTRYSGFVQRWNYRSYLGVGWTGDCASTFPLSFVSMTGSSPPPPEYAYLCKGAGYPYTPFTVQIN